MTTFILNPSDLAHLQAHSHPLSPIEREMMRLNQAGPRPPILESLLFLCFCFFLLLLQSDAQPTTNGSTCAANRSVYPCQAYAFYRVASERDLASVGDLFGVSRAMIARASNLSTSTALSQGQPLLVPLACSCGASTNFSYAPVAYQINAGDTFYLVSTGKFANLTTYQAVEAVNPSLIPTQLQIGVITIFPIFCQCPTNKTGNNGTVLVTYAFRPSDTFASIASSFGTDVQSLVSLNGREDRIKPFTTVLIPVTQIPPPLLLRNGSQTSSPPPPPPSPPPPPTTSPPTTRDRKGAVIGLAVALGLMGALWVMLLLALAWFWRRSTRRRIRRRGEEEGKGGGGEFRREKGGGKGLGGFASDEYRMSDISEWLDKYKLYEIEDLRRATSDFDHSRLIQGSVYKGIIDGEVYAVKKMKWNACDELKILQKVNHTNLVKLEGFCIHTDDGSCYLVYEYVENGSLHSWLHDTTGPQKLDWRTRLHIALDLANGLQYIHEHTWPRVVHKDIKSSNVLLDAKMRAKIANFGLAKTGLNAVTTHIVGTQGYIAPEYLADGLVTTKLDVFAYGVVLLELISGKEAVNNDGEALWMDAQRVLLGQGGNKEGRLREWMDVVLLEQLPSPVESVMSVMSIAGACLQRDPTKRPSMVDVAYSLSKADDAYSDFSADALATAGSDELAAR